VAQWHHPNRGLLIANGIIYGTTNAGGANGSGIIYSMSTSGANFTDMHDFAGDPNGGPQGMMIFGQDGAIYGTQFGGGQYNQGVIWRMTTGGSYQVLYNFLGNIQPGNSTDGATPEGPVALGPDGTIYGTTSSGGDPSGDGTAWSIKLVNGTWVYKQIYEFNGNTGGSLPHGGRILASDGALYGTTAGGGIYGGGTFYKLTPNGSAWSYVTLHNFIPLDPNGDSPYGDLLYANSKFYGMNLTGGVVSQCDNGCGTVFQFILHGTAHDYNGDGRSDIAWRDTTTDATSGALAMWLMNGTQVTNADAEFAATVPYPMWTVIGNGDFNGDGSADILWRDNSGNLVIWEMMGTQIINPTAEYVGNVSGWSISGIGDFNGDGKSDILWSDGKGNYALWEMNGTQIINPTTEYVGNVIGWSVVGIGDFNGDGKSDILWTDGKGNHALWEMNGTQVVNPTAEYVANITGWSVVRIGDFNGDGKSDILWTDGKGNYALWEMNGTQIINPSAECVANVSGWSVTGTGDYNGDGTSDILWTDGKGNYVLWEMNGTQIINPSAEYVANVTTNWAVQLPLGE
jgi:uncharacterized repeat protein (TIGR03803 family)